MTKNVIIGTLVLLVAFFATYASIKANEAEKERAIAEANLELAEQHRAAAEEAEKVATEQAAKAIDLNKLVVDTQKALDKCQGK